MKWLVALCVVIYVAGPVGMWVFGGLRFDQQWYEADRSASGLAPSADSDPRARVQVYAARAFNWRGVFAVHTWIVVKAVDASAYTVHEVTRWSGQTRSKSSSAPDRRWFGNSPRLLFERVGAGAGAMIPAIEQAVADYPFATYRAWPGPNSNTFTAWVIRQVPALAVALPPTAVGKDYVDGAMVTPTPSETGYQLSVNGLLGLLVGTAEGVELNCLGLVLGVDLTGPALLLPGVGRVGFADWRPTVRRARRLDAASP